MHCIVSKFRYLELIVAQISYAFLTGRKVGDFAAGFTALFALALSRHLYYHRLSGMPLTLLEHHTSRNPPHRLAAPSFLHHLLLP